MGFDVIATGFPFAVVVAGLCSCFAESYVLGAVGSGVAWLGGSGLAVAAFVNLTVAVIVFCVADLLGGDHFILAGTPLTILAGLGSLGTKSDAACAVFSAVALSGVAVLTLDLSRGCLTWRIRLYEGAGVFSGFFGRGGTLSLLADLRLFTVRIELTRAFTATGPEEGGQGQQTKQQKGIYKSIHPKIRVVVRSVLPCLLSSKSLQSLEKSSDITLEYGKLYCDIKVLLSSWERGSR